MAYLDPQEAFAHFRDRALEGIQMHFPIKGKVQTLTLDKLELKDDQDADDLRTQHRTKLEGGNFTVPVFAHLTLRDNTTGKIVDQRRMRLAEIPKMTQRYSYIVDGNEYQVDNQWQLKPGAYTRRRNNGELETRFNVSNASSFDMVFDPGSKQFHLEYNKAKLPVHPLMKALGVDDDTIERTLGKDVAEANRNARGAEGTLEKFYKTDRRVAAPSKTEAEHHFYETMQASTMRPDVTALTLGKPIDHVNGEALLLAAQKLLKVQGGHPEDDRDSLIFKDLRSTGDFAFDKLHNAAKGIATKASRKINTARDIRDIVKFDLFNEPIRQTFKKNAAARLATQINPVEMVSSNLQTTIMGPGGIQSERSITHEAKFINPTHLGFLDPISTPEGSRTGVSLRMPIGIKKVGNEPKLRLYNLKTGQDELVGPATFFTSKVVLPDQIGWKDGKPVSLGTNVKMAGHGNEIVEGKLSEAHYVMRHPSQLLNMTSNLIPFLGNTSGNRASMATRHIEQAISLLHRDVPLVQVSTGVTGRPGMESFEQVLGREASHQSPVDGVVKQIKPDAIVISGTDGKSHEVQIYNNYPLNDAKSVLHSMPTVKVGDKVKARQTISDTNFTKNGTLALGINMRVAYIPFKGYNFEDGVVISETAAKKLSSVHLYKNALPVDRDTTVSKRSFNIHHPSAFKSDQLAHIGDDGVASVGSIVQPGDPLVLAIKPYALKDRMSEAAIRKALTGTHTDKSLKWDGETAGEVVGVSRGKDSVQVHVKTIEPMQVGDKISGRYGNKGICTMVLPDKEMPHTKDGKHIEVALNPSGVPGRMNVGQVLETAASKIARKTGKMYIVPSFNKEADMVEHVRNELKHHGLSDTEELHDPVTGQNLGEALVGEQHILKLVHQVDKKVAVSSGMASPSNPATYDINLQPKHGQRIGSLGIYAMLAHGARANLREMQTWKGEGVDDLSKAESKQWKSQHNEVWKAIQTGSPLPTPKSTFAFKKFEDILKGAGVNLEKQGHHLLLSPLTDKQVLALTEHRVLPHAGERLDTKIDKNTGELKGRPGGLFDERLTGGHGGLKWSRIELAEPLANPVFEAPVRSITRLVGKDYDAITSGEKGILPNGQIAALGKGVLTGGAAIKHLLTQIDVKAELKKSHQELLTAKNADVDKVLKRTKYLRALDQLEMRPEEAYVLHHLPVLPPAMRPASLMHDGNVKYADLNQLYSDFAQVNDQLKDPIISKNLTEQGKANLRRNLMDGLRAISGIGIPYDQAKHKGLLHQLSGAQPKTGYYQNVLVQKRQDLTMRSTIVPEPALGLDEVGLPRAHALELFRPFVVKKLVDMGAAHTPLDAHKLLLKPNNTSVQAALEKVMIERPVLLKRDPVLHKYGVQGFQPKVVEGNAIKIHPLVCGGFNADFDGNCFVGSTKTVLQITDELWEKIGTEGSGTDMKFGSTTRVLHRTGAGVFAETTLEHLPYLPHTKRLDKNGASVYELPRGMRVWSYDHSQGVPVMESVTHITIEDNCPIGRITTRRGMTVDASLNESLCVYDHETELVRDLCPKDAVGRLSPVLRQVPSDGSLFDFETGWMFGAFASDGFVSGETVFGFAKASDLHRDRFAWAVVSFEKGQVHRKTYRDYHSEEEEISGESVKDHFSRAPRTLSFLMQCYDASFFKPHEGRASLYKKLPDLTHFSRSALLGVLTGLLDCDGTISISNAKGSPQVLASFSTSSKFLVESIQQLCRLLAVRVGVTSSHPKPGRLQKHTSYVLSFSTVDLSRFALDLVVTTDETTSALMQLVDREMKDDNDIVPVPHWIMRLAASSKGPCAAHASLATIKSSKKTGPYISRPLARRVLQELRSANVPNLGSWERVVFATSVHWDVVTSVENLGNDRVFDLVVPSTKVFAVNDGLVVWDTMSVFVPISREAVAEAHKMKPTNNIFMESSGKVAFSPTLEAHLGLYKLSLLGKDSGKNFKHPGEVLDAVRTGKIGYTDKVDLEGKATTAGRILLAETLPDAMQHDVLHNLDMRLNGKGLSALLTRLGKDHKGDFDKSLNKLKDLGNHTSFGAVALPLTHTAITNITDPKKNIFIPIGTHSLSLKDFDADKSTRKEALAKAEEDIAKVNAMNLNVGEKARRRIEIYNKADEAMKAAHEKKYDANPTNLFTMYRAGVKPGWSQYKQMVLAPMLLKDSADRIIPTPVTKSYAEGLDVADYWTQMQGARRGTVLKVQEVQEPGYMSKLLMNNTVGMLIGDHDCGTQRGILMGVHEPDIHDRVLAQDYKNGAVQFKAGDMITPALVGQVAKADKNAKLLVRSPLKCEHPHGLCQSCAGLSSDGKFHDMGTNIGVIATHTLGERAVQLTLKSFHGGGVVEQGGGKLLGAFDRFKQLTHLPQKIPNAASLAMASGTIDRIEPTGTGVNVVINGRRHFVGKDTTGNPLHQPLGSDSSWGGLHLGMKVAAGDSLSDPTRTYVNPHDLYKATGSIDAVQNHMATEIYNLYKDEGIKRRHVETAVKAISNLTKVVHPGDAEGILRGEFQPLSVVQKMNSDLVKQGKRPVEHTPVLKGVDMLPLALQEDWMAMLQHQKLRSTIAEAASLGSHSNIHGNNPIPGLALGSEFGLTSKDALKPGLGHLHDVPVYRY